MNNKRSRNQATAPPQAASAPGLPALSGADGPGRPAVAGAQVLVQQTAYSGQVPPPEILEGFDRLVPGTAARIIAWAEEEQSHRHRLEHDAQAANIESQRRQLAIGEYQSRAVFRSDMVGQVLGFAVCAGCASGAVMLGLAGQTGAAVALAAIPTAAVLQAMRTFTFGKKP